MNSLGKFMNKLFYKNACPELDRRTNEEPAERGIFMKRRNDALNTLQAHGLSGHYYLPASKISDNTLAEA